MWGPTAAVVIPCGRNAMLRVTSGVLLARLSAPTWSVAPAAGIASALDVQSMVTSAASSFCILRASEGPIGPPDKKLLHFFGARNPFSRPRKAHVRRM